MGLAERRAVKEFQDKRLPQLKKDLDAAASLEVPLEVNWETLATEEQSHLYEEAWTKLFFIPLTRALTDITRDDMGKEALKSGLKKVIIQNTKENYSSSSWATFTQGTLILDHMISNVDDVDDRTQSLIKLLESKL